MKNQTVIPGVILAKKKSFEVRIRTRRRPKRTGLCLGKHEEGGKGIWNVEWGRRKHEA